MAKNTAKTVKASKPSPVIAEPTPARNRGPVLREFKLAKLVELLGEDATVPVSIKGVESLLLKQRQDSIRQEISAQLG
jgi:hypothetical protein